MGIKDLLPSLQQMVIQKSIKDFYGMRIAIDVSGWLHKSLYAVVEDFVDSGFQDSQLYVDYILMRVNELRSYGVEPVIVFDGKRSYLKSETNAKREEARRLYMENGRRLLDSMRSTTDHACAAKLKSEAISCFQKGMAVTHEMEKNTIASLHKLQISVVVAPYEADSQLVYLCQSGICQAVITEDSDVLVYAAICGKSFPILYKFDKVTHMVQCLNLEKILNFNEELSPLVLSQESNSSSSSSISYSNSGYYSNNNSNSNSNNSVIIENSQIVTKDSNFVKNLKYFNGPRGRRMFVQMCVLAGCDYCDSIHGVGMITAQQAILKFKQVADDIRLQRVCHYLQITCKKNVPDTYLLRAQRAEALFHYHVVYNPRKKVLCHFMPPNITQPLIKSSENDEFWDESSFYTTSDSQSSIIGIWKGPTIDEKELALLGTDTLNELLRDSIYTGSITAEKICLGHVSIKDYTSIVPRFPWETPGLTHPHQQRISAHNNRSTVSYIWNYRNTLIQHFGNGKQLNQHSSSTVHMNNQQSTWLDSPKLSQSSQLSYQQHHHHHHQQHHHEKNVTNTTSTTNTLQLGHTNQNEGITDLNQFISTSYTRNSNQMGSISMNNSNNSNSNDNNSNNITTTKVSVSNESSSFSTRPNIRNKQNICSPYFVEKEIKVHSNLQVNENDTIDQLNSKSKSNLSSSGSSLTTTIVNPYSRLSSSNKTILPKSTIQVIANETTSSQQELLSIVEESILSQESIDSSPSSASIYDIPTLVILDIESQNSNSCLSSEKDGYPSSIPLETPKNNLVMNLIRNENDDNQNDDDQYDQGDSSNNNDDDDIDSSIHKNNYNHQIINTEDYDSSNHSIVYHTQSNEMIGMNKQVIFKPIVTRISSSSSSSGLPPLDPHIPPSTMFPLSHTIQPVNLNKRKFVEVSVPISRGGSSVKKLKSSCNTMKLTSIRSFFTPLKTVQHSS